MINVFGGIEHVRGWHVSQCQNASDDTQKCRNVHLNFFLDIKFNIFWVIPKCIHQPENLGFLEAPESGPDFTVWWYSLVY